MEKICRNSKFHPLNLPLGVQRKWEGQMQKNLKFYYKELNKRKCANSNIKILGYYWQIYFVISKIKKDFMKILMVEPETQRSFHLIICSHSSKIFTRKSRYLYTNIKKYCDA